jgi:hypothetical protein
VSLQISIVLLIKYDKTKAVGEKPAKTNAFKYIYYIYIYKILLHASALMGHPQGVVHYKTPI